MMLCPSDEMALCASDGPHGMMKMRLEKLIVGSARFYNIQTTESKKI